MHPIFSLFSLNSETLFLTRGPQQQLPFRKGKKKGKLEQTILVATAELPKRPLSFIYAFISLIALHLVSSSTLCFRHCLFLLHAACCCCARRAAQSQSQPLGEAELLLQMKRARGDPPPRPCSRHGIGPPAPPPRPRARTAAGHTRGATRRPSPASTDITRLDTSLQQQQHHRPACFPTALGLPLQYLDLSYNYLQGELPDDIGYGLGANLSTLDFGLNKFRPYP